MKKRWGQTDNNDNDNNNDDNGIYSVGDKNERSSGWLGFMPGWLVFRPG